MTFEESFETYVSEMRQILFNAAKTKGYHGLDTDGRKLFDEAHSDNYAHPIGEIKYKMRRFQSVRDTHDIAKVGAWAFLIWDKHNRDTQQ